MLADNQEAGPARSAYHPARRERRAGPGYRRFRMSAEGGWNEPRTGADEVVRLYCLSGERP